MNRLGLVVIGRNEGERLRRCLQSLVRHGLPLVYVDSASSDGSAELARSMGAVVVELDPTIPMNAARARNAGFERLMRECPEVELVQFVDGDCELIEGWLEAATAAMDARADVAVVCGRRRERFPEASPYNRLADMEWNTPVGEALACGGDFVVRAGAFSEINGFNAEILAGEEPEMCSRLRGRGWKILRIDHAMTWHDSAMTRFSQWWRRAIRSGYGAMDVVLRAGAEGERLFGREVRSTKTWALGWPMALAGATVIGGVLGGRIGAIIAAVALLGVWVLQVLKIAMRVRRALGVALGLRYAWLMMVCKWAQLFGQIKRRMARGIRFEKRSPALEGVNQ